MITVRVNKRKPHFLNMRIDPIQNAVCLESLTILQMTSIMHLRKVSGVGEANTRKNIVSSLNQITEHFYSRDHAKLTIFEIPQKPLNWCSSMAACAFPFAEIVSIPGACFTRLWSLQTFFFEGYLTMIPSSHPIPPEDGSALSVTRHQDWVHHFLIAMGQTWVWLGIEK